MKKKIQKNNSSTFLIIFFSALLAIVIIAVYLNKLSNNSYNQSQTTNNSNETRIYESQFLKFSLEFPIDWEIQENITFSNIVSNIGRINVSRIATNFENISDYLKDFDSKRTITVSEEKYLNIDKHNAIVRMEIFNGGPIAKQKVYFIFIDNWVYSISTSSEALFDELDQIAQSFKYTPN